MLKITTTKIRTPGQVATHIGRSKHRNPDADTTRLYQELGIAHVAKKAREIVAKFPAPSEDQIQAVVEILRGGDAA